MERAGSNSSIEQGKAGKPERPHSSIQQSHYARPSATITKMQPVLPPLGPKPKAKAVPPPVVPGHVILGTSCLCMDVLSVLCFNCELRCFHNLLMRLVIVKQALISKVLIDANSQLMHVSH